jgi:hypothetical protein
MSRHCHDLNRAISQDLIMRDWEWLITHTEFHHSGNQLIEASDHVVVTRPKLHYLTYLNPAEEDDS